MAQAIPETKAQDWKGESKQLRAQVDALRKEHYGLMKSIYDWFQGLNKKGVLSIRSAQIDSTPIGSLDPSTGVFTSVSALLTLTSSVTIPAGYGAYIPDTYEIGASATLEIGAGGVLEIG